MLKNVGHQQMQDMLCDVGKVSQDHLETSLRHWGCVTFMLARVGIECIATSLFGNAIGRYMRNTKLHQTEKSKKVSGEIISKPLPDRRWCETVMVARVGGTTTADCGGVGDPIGTPESPPQSAAVPRTANKCCVKQNWISRRNRKPDFSPAGKRISFGNNRRVFGKETNFLERQFLGVSAKMVVVVKQG